MKKLILIMLLLMFTTSALAITPDEYIRTRQRLGSGNKWLDPLYLHILDNYNTLAFGGDIFYVDGNMRTSGNGTSWEQAYKTLAEALAASHADMAVSGDRQWASRNRIYCKGDTLTEDLSALAQKTDIWGVGNNNPYDKCGLLGNHDILSTTLYPSCRFYNMQFYGDQADAVWDIDGQGGIEFHGCLFQANGNATIGLKVSECSYLEVEGCEFGSADGIDFSSAAIQIEDDTSEPQNTRIHHNIIKSDGIGIDWDETDQTGCIIYENIIRAAGMLIDDEGDDVWVINNNMMTQTYGKVAFDFNITKAQNNILTTPVRTVTIPYNNECAGAVAAAKRGAFGTIYYVDGNMAASGGDGMTWETACQSLVTALAKSHANAAVSAQRNWAARNTIYVRGDAITEDFVLLAQKTDVVGVGVNNPYDKAGIIGTWIIPDTHEGPSCRFFNMQFYDDTAGGSLWDVTDQAGLEFHNCLFQANNTSAYGLELNNCPHTKVIDCWFGSPDGQNFTSAAIQVVNDATGSIGILIKDNRIHSNGIGIDWDETTNVDCWIDSNRFFTAGMCIDSDDVTEVMVVNNIGITLLANVADNTSNDFNIDYAVNNMFVAVDVAEYIPTFNDD